MQPAVILAHPSPDWYGSDRMFIESVRAVLDAGYRAVVTLPTDGPLSAHLTEIGADVHIIATPVLRRGALSASGILGLAWQALTSTPASLTLMRQHRARALYVNTLTIPWWTVLGKLNRTPTIVHVHEAERSTSKYVLLGLNLSLTLANRVLVNSQFARDTIADVLPAIARRATLLLNGVEGPPHVDVPTSPHDRVDLVYVGRISERKGVAVAVDALADLHERGIRAHLHLVGAVFPGYEWFEQALEERISTLGLTKHVTHHGFTHDPFALVRSAHIQLVPSVLDEPFGNTAVEAVLAQRPAVVSNTSGLREAGGPYATVHLVPAGDARAIADAVQDITARWQEVEAQLPAARALAQQRHAPANYRRKIRRALGLPALADGKSPTPRIAVAALTYQRNDLLPGLIQALQAQATTIAPHAEVIIVDNDAQASGRHIAEPLLAEGGGHYFHHPEGGIAEARNRALDEARALGVDAIVFIDDDETPCDGWLKLLVDQYTTSRCDGVVGPVTPDYLAPVPRWIENGKFFITARRRTGTRVPMAATNNLLLDLQSLEDLNLRFDPAYSKSGGSDAVLTWQITRAGGQLVWVDEAVVADRVPPSRMTNDWVMRRSFRLANSKPRVDIDISRDGPVGATIKRGYYLATGAARVGAGLGRAAFGTLQHNQFHQGRGLRTAARGLGMVTGALGYRYQEYRRPQAAKPSLVTRILNFRAPQATS